MDSNTRRLRRKNVLAIHELIVAVEKAKGLPEVTEQNNMQFWNKAQRWEEGKFLKYNSTICQDYQNTINEKLVLLRGLLQQYQSPNVPARNPRPREIPIQQQAQQTHLPRHRQSPAQPPLPSNFSHQTVGVRATPSRPSEAHRYSPVVPNNPPPNSRSHVPYQQQMRTNTQQQDPQQEQQLYHQQRQQQQQQRQQFSREKSAAEVDEMYRVKFYQVKQQMQGGTLQRIAVLKEFMIDKLNVLKQESGSNMAKKEQAKKCQQFIVYLDYSQDMLRAPGAPREGFREGLAKLRKRYEFIKSTEVKLGPALDSYKAALASRQMLGRNGGPSQLPPANRANPQTTNTSVNSPSYQDQRNLAYRKSPTRSLNVMQSQVDSRQITSQQQQRQKQHQNMQQQKQHQHMQQQARRAVAVNATQPTRGINTLNGLNSVNPSSSRPHTNKVQAQQSHQHSRNHSFPNPAPKMNNSSGLNASYKAEIVKKRKAEEIPQPVPASPAKMAKKPNLSMQFPGKQLNIFKKNSKVEKPEVVTKHVPVYKPVAGLPVAEASSKDADFLVAGDPDVGEDTLLKESVMLTMLEESMSSPEMMAKLDWGSAGVTAMDVLTELDSVF